MPECKQRYMRIADKNAEEKLDRLLSFLRDNDIGFFTMGEKTEGSQKFVHVFVDIKISSSNTQKVSNVIK